jgi:hypothetical protein
VCGVQLELVRPRVGKEAERGAVATVTPWPTSGGVGAEPTSGWLVSRLAWG